MKRLLFALAFLLGMTAGEWLAPLQERDENRSLVPIPKEDTDEVRRFGVKCHDSGPKSTEDEDDDIVVPDSAR